MPTCRLLPYRIEDGAINMAIDEAMLESALAGLASLRLYGWSEPTVSLGYFQPASVWESDPLLRALPMVRRPTGGEMLVHHHELTYALALPAGKEWRAAEGWACRMHTAIVRALNDLGVPARLAGQEEQPASTLCFHHPTAGDVLIGSAKVVGSAQRKRRGAILQHGAILLAASPFAPQLPGIRELAGRELEPAVLIQAILSALSWKMQSADWSEQERRRAGELGESRYSQTSWNRKR